MERKYSSESKETGRHEKPLPDDKTRMRTNRLFLITEEYDERGGKYRAWKVTMEVLIAGNTCEAKHRESTSVKEKSVSKWKK